VVAGLGLGRKQVGLEVTGFSGMDRRAVVDESVTILRRVWSEDSVTHSGQLFSFEDAQIKPKPARPLPLWYGGTTRAAIRRAVGAFDGWMPGGLPLDTLNDRLAYLREQSEAAGRRLPVIGYIPRLSIARSRAEARAAIDLSTMAMGSEGTKHWVRPKSGGFERIEDLHGAILVGEPEDVVEQVLELGQQGIDHVVFDLRHQFDRYEENLELIGERVLPALRAELARA
jgi:alkanesulfonate monooxygenase SsuD/methylene tetrahydromethanopterin reductase-like flavin-dependent oxidoreductase (luciferase family)